MTNIVTRKGLAFGALVALASTAIAGAPAHAAGEINVAPTAGTSYNTIAGEAFTLEASFAPGFAPAAASQLKYVVTTDGSAIKVGEAKTSAADAITALATASLNSSNSVVVNSARTAATERSFLAVQVPVATDTESVSVTAFADANNNGALDAGEWNTVRTLGFKKVADVTASTTVAAPVVGDTTIKATINFGDLNTQQIAIAKLGAAFKKGTGSYSAGTVSYNTDGTVAAQITGQTVAAGDVFTAQPLYKAAGSPATTDVIATTGSATGVAAGFAFFASVKGSAASGQIKTVTSGASAYTDATTPANNVTAATGAITVKTNDTFAVTAVVKNNASTPAVVAGQVVNVTVSTTGVLNTATDSTAVNLTVNGTKYTSASALPGQGSVAKLALTSNANGEVVVNIASTGLVDAKTITLAFDSQNITVSTVVTEEDLDYTVSESNANDIYSTTPGASQALTYTVKDQFGVSAAGALRVKAVVTGGTANTFYGNVSAGVATLTVTDSQLATASSWTDNTVVASLEKQDSASLNWSTAAAGTTAVTTDSTVIKYTTTANDFSTPPAVAYVTNGAGNTAAYNSTSNYKQTITQSAIADLTTAPAANGSATWAKLTFTGTNQGEKIDITAPGVVIWANAKANDGAASVQAGASADSIYVASNTVGTKTVTFKTGAVTKTVDVVFVALDSAEATATTFAVAVSASAQAGRAIDATVTVTDKWGNAVAGFDVTASVSGVAVVNGGFAANATTDANGKATVKLSAGVNDLGDAVVTFSDNDSNTTTNVTSVAKTVTFGSTDGYIDVLNGKRASVTWSFAKGKRVAVYLDGVRRYNIVQPGDSELNLQFNLKKGSHSIKLVIGGVIVDTLSVKVAG